jgi:hypothetical protein
MTELERCTANPTTFERVVREQSRDYDAAGPLQNATDERTRRLLIRGDAYLPLIGRRPTNHLFVQPKPRDRRRERGVYFFRRRSCFGDDVGVRVSRSGDDLRICCSYRRNFYPKERMQKPLTTAADWNRPEDTLTATSF